ILTLGIPAALTQVLNPVAQGGYMRMASSTGGVYAVAAMATGTRIENFVFIIAISYGIAIVPFVGHNYGARAFDRIQQARRISNGMAIVYAIITLLLLLPSAGFLSGLFSQEKQVIEMSRHYLIIATLGHAGFYISNWMSQLLNVIAHPIPVMIINLSRVFIFLLPLCLLGCHLFGFRGLLMGIAAGNTLAGLLAYLLTRKQLQTALASNT
ncbi:MAG: hypothetical protein JW713_09805, partial [Pontiellaceae bacterium]|nr:hypothetical protein [Pontiellaceae bacterium]